MVLLLHFTMFRLNDIKDLPELPNMSYEEREKLYQEANLFSNEDLKTD